MISISLEMHSLQLDGPAQAVIWNNANNRSQHISGYYKQTDGALPGRLWKSGEILEGLEREELCPCFFLFFFLTTILMKKFWLDSSGRQRFHLVQPQECLKYDI